MTTTTSGPRSAAAPRPVFPRLDAGPGDAAEPFDAITELFLGERARAEESPAAAAPATARPAVVEGIVLGHLPVFAGAWVAEYARHVAAETGRPVALARLAGGQARIDLFGARGAGRAASAQDAVRDAAALAPRWIVRVTEDDEARLAASARLSRLTVLSGADDAAIVAAYRAVKGLASPTPGAEREIGVALMGAPPARAAEIEEKLLAVSRTFLGAPIRVVASVERIGGGECATIFQGPSDMDADSLLALIDSAGVAPAAPPPAAGPAPRAAAPAHRPAPPAPLAGLIDGLRPVRARCPHAPEVELAIDASGRLHLVAGAEGDVGRPVAGLIGAAAWARAHQALLELATPGLTPGGEPVLHLLTDNPAAARPLLDSAVRVHFLRWVHAGGARVPVRVALN